MEEREWKQIIEKLDEFFNELLLEESKNIKNIEWICESYIDSLREKPLLLNKKAPKKDA